ncbi:nuclease-related domain-containing protein [Planctomonas psychrotolerans]|uniref:nuclease-related domain-containing protein n=1 Tax=Planctomonas psychrotolerans TaxID=2528712 RepID=UPI00123C3E36|nr:nuclease-related domain-containing protein [Planctomonas psychrotolerans]
MPTAPMRSRAAGQLVIEKLLEVQNGVPPRSSLSRVFGRSPLSDESWPWYQGALGEIAVGRIMSKLPEGWVVFHAVPVGAKDADLDHLLVGPGGIFTINTKHHSGKPIWVADRTFLVAGQKGPHLRNAEHDADRVARMLGDHTSAVVTPMLVLVDPKSLTVRKAPARVVVLDARSLVRWLTRRPTVLEVKDVLAIVSVLDDPSEWRSVPTATTDLMPRFERLDRDVRVARARRRLWSLGAVIAGMATLVPLMQWVPQLLLESLTRLVA